MRNLKQYKIIKFSPFIPVRQHLEYDYYIKYNIYNNIGRIYKDALGQSCIYIKQQDNQLYNYIKKELFKENSLKTARLNKIFFPSQAMLIKSFILTKLLLNSKN